MKRIKGIALFCFLGYWMISCSCAYQEPDLLDDLLNGNTTSIISHFKDKEKINAKKIAHTLAQYAKLIEKRQLSVLRVDDPFSLHSSLSNSKEIKEVAYFFLDDNNNVVASVNFVYEIVPEGLSLISVAFRNSEGKLQCAQYPGEIPLACVNLPIQPTPELKELTQIYPRKVGDFELIPLSHVLTERFGYDRDQPQKKIIAFNIGNQIINDKLAEILFRIGQEIDLSKLRLVESKLIGEPTINIGFDPKFHARKEVEFIQSILEELIAAEVRLIPTDSGEESAFRTRIPVLSIGYANSENKLIYLFENQYIIEVI